MICRTCKRTKDESEFHWRNRAQGKRKTQCKACAKICKDKWYAVNRERQIELAKIRAAINKPKHVAKRYAIMREYLEKHSCDECGEKDLRTLEFHHVTGGKEGGVMRILLEGTLEAMWAEVKKCIVLCANCHKKITYAGSWRDI